MFSWKPNTKLCDWIFKQTNQYQMMQPTFPFQISSKNWVTLTTINCCQNEPNQIIEKWLFIKYACTISDEISPKSYNKKGIMKMKALTMISV